MSEFLFTSESVTGGHPDKVADQISDAVLDGILRQDPRGRVACETMVTTGLVVVAGGDHHEGDRRFPGRGPQRRSPISATRGTRRGSTPTTAPWSLRSTASPPTSRRGSTGATRRSRAPGTRG